MPHEFVTVSRVGFGSGWGMVAQGESRLLALLRDHPEWHCRLAPETPWCCYHVVLAEALHHLRRELSDAG